MSTNRVASASVSAGAVPTGADTALVSIAPGVLNPGYSVLVRADLALIGAVSVTSVTVKIHRGQSTAGAAVYTRQFTVTGAVNVAAVATFTDNAYDGAGYTVSAQAAGAAATADATIEAQSVVAVF